MIDAPHSNYLNQPGDSFVNKRSRSETKQYQLKSIYNHKEDTNEQFKQPAGVGCNRTSRKTRRSKFTALEDVAEAAAVILMEGPEKHNGKDYWFSADLLTPHQVAETLTAATGRKFTAAVRNAEGFQNDAAQPNSSFEPAYAKGGFELFGQVEDGTMAYVGSVIDDTKKLLGREPLIGLKTADCAAAAGTDQTVNWSAVVAALAQCGLYQ